MKSLARIKREEAEKEARRIEKQRLKEEKNKAKLEQKRIERRKKKKKAQNERYRSKLREQEQSRRKKLGDEHAFFSIYIVKNKKRVKWVGSSWWKTDAYAKFNSAIEQNQQQVQFPVEILTKSGNDSRKNHEKKVGYEIIIIKKINETEDNVRQFRNNDGKFVDNVITDRPSHVIVAKNEWLVEETFNVYGYHPIKDRKTFDFIYNELLLSDMRDDGDPKRVRTLMNKLIIEKFDDFDLVITKNADQCQRLYDMLQKKAISTKQKQILFTGEVSQPLVSTMFDKIERKTGWNRKLIQKNSVT